MVRHICEITVTLDFSFQLVHCSSEVVSFNSMCLNVLEGIKQFYLLILFKKPRLVKSCQNLYDSKRNSRSDVDGHTHTKQLLNLLCIV